MEDNMNLEEKLTVKDMVVLEDDNTYIVSANAVVENIEYFFFVDANNSQNFKVGYQDKGDIAVTSDEELIKVLMPKFGRSAIKTIKELMKSNEN